MKNVIPAIFILFILSVSCQEKYAHLYTYSQPKSINDGIQVGTLYEVNIDTILIASAVGKIFSGKYNEVHSMLIFKDKKLVFEEYFQGHRYKWDAPNHHGEMVNWDKFTPHHIMSATKSITSMCIGIAIEKGYIKSVNQPISDYLPEYKHLLINGKEKITIEHLLTMTSGLEWDEWGAPLSSSKNDLVGLWVYCEDPVNCILECDLKNEPGTNFTYSGGNMVLLSEIIKAATNMDIDEFSKKYLFESLGVDSSVWVQRFDNGMIYSGGGLIITPREMVKIGAAVLNNGNWNGKQIISEEWIKKCYSEYGNNNGINIPGQASGRHGYSYSWWLKSYTKSGKKSNMYNAGGWGGQEIIVIPELNTVVVFTGGTYTSNVKVFDLLENYIIPAIK